MRKYNPPLCSILHYTLLTIHCTNSASLFMYVITKDNLWRYKVRFVVYQYVIELARDLTFQVDVQFLTLLSKSSCPISTSHSHWVLTIWCQISDAQWAPVVSGVVDHHLRRVAAVPNSDTCSCVHRGVCHSGATQLMMTEERVEEEEVKIGLSGGDGGPSRQA